MEPSAISSTPAGASLAAPSDPKPKDAKDAAQQFEALLINQMLRNVHESSAGSLGDEEDSTSGTMWDMAAQQFSSLLAKNGGLGLAKLISTGLEQHPSPPPPDSTIRR